LAPGVPFGSAQRKRNDGAGRSEVRYKDVSRQSEFGAPRLTGRKAGDGKETRAGMQRDAARPSEYDLGKVRDTRRFVVDR